MIVNTGRTVYCLYSPQDFNCVVVIFLFVISFAVEGGRGFDILNDDLFHATSLNTFPVGRELTELLTYDTSSSGRHYFHGHFIFGHFCLIKAF